MLFKPTHLITLPNGEKKKIMLVDKWAYEGYQWAESMCAEYYFDGSNWSGLPPDAEIKEYEPEELEYSFGK